MVCQAQKIIALFSQCTGDFRQFTSAAARLELAIYNKDKKLLATGAARETLAGGTYIIAAKEAIAQTALKLAGEFFPVMK